MRRFLVALAVAGLVAGGSGAAAQASGLEHAAAVPGAVLTPDQVGITHPAQGFLPFFQSAGQGTGIGLGNLGPTTFSSAALFSGQGGCGVFSTLFCPFFTAAPFTQTFISQNGGTLGLGNQFGIGGVGSFVGLGGFGFNPGLFGANQGQLSTAVTGNVFGTGVGSNVGQLSTAVTGNPFGFGFGTGFGFGPGAGLGTGFGVGTGFGTGAGTGPFSPITIFP